MKREEADAHEKGEGNAMTLDGPTLPDRRGGTP
jgi:hypothetical protein